MLSFMARGFYGESELLFLPLIGLVLFMLVFVFVTYRVFRTDTRALDRLAALPLADDLKPLSGSKGLHHG